MSRTEGSRTSRKRKVEPNKSYRWSEEGLDRDEQHRLRREALLRTAARAFNETGFHSTSVEDLAKRLNVTKPTLYYYVKDKDEILFECQRMGFDMMREALEEARAGSGSGMKKLCHFLTRFAELMATDFGACLILTGLKPLRPASRAKLAVFARQLDTALRDIIKQGIADGSIRPSDPKLTTFAIFGAFKGIASWYDANGPLKPAAIAEAFLDIIVQGLKPRT
ncbi:AcrR family transcriptional regulator [Bradyrhizobium diazoefficiens]